MKKFVISLLISVFLISGCTGTFQATRSVYKFHRSQENKWLDEAVFLGVSIIPVYGLATLGDAVIFNSVEFWTKKNPLLDASMAGKSLGEDIILERTAQSIIVKDKSGTVLYTSIKDSEGGITVYDGNDMMVSYFSPEEIQDNKMQLSMN